ncbi:hypothetical protein AM499_06505 [Bacillus sp. FJAT-22090]|uniref:hypothetical protein n=1 Tax=Bacillus sp. FJAT-22090 TaxID=1581038 RepID=UPI0006AECEE0|nr:hypothetical protein [Bacillus sp. FJAT-22090]ALC85503.1 hypothetical protein AM499_06505 [Bacillus sp. FJAT-22090]
MIRNIFKRKDPIEAFWEWFVEHEEELYLIRDEHSVKLLKELDAVTSKVNRQLSFSIELEENKDKKRELTISAYGNPNNFPDVIRLVEAAPQLERFTIVAFNQRNDDDIAISSNGFEVSREDVFFTYEVDQENEEFYLILYIKEFREDVEHSNAVLEFLEIVIGEYVLGTEITEIEFKKFNSEEGLLPINELPNVLDQVKKNKI